MVIGVTNSSICSRDDGVEIDECGTGKCVRDDTACVKIFRYGIAAPDWWAFLEERKRVGRSALSAPRGYFVGK
jgi:hypothetical protein